MQNQTGSKGAGVSIVRARVNIKAKYYHEERHKLMEALV
jgi:hypothetical protein